MKCEYMHSLHVYNKFGMCQFFTNVRIIYCFASCFVSAIRIINHSYNIGHEEQIEICM